MKRLHYYSVQLYDALEQETGHSVGLHKCGSLRLADTPQRVDEIRYQMSRQGWNQVNTRLYIIIIRTLSLDTLPRFRRELKTFLFRQSYPSIVF